MTPENQGKTSFSQRQAGSLSQVKLSKKDYCLLTLNKELSRNRMYLVPDLSDKTKVLESMRLAKELIQSKGKSKLYDAYTST